MAQNPLTFEYVGPVAAPPMRVVGSVPMVPEGPSGLTFEPVTPAGRPAPMSRFLGGVADAINPIPLLQSISKMGADRWGAAQRAAAVGDYTGAILKALEAHPVTIGGEMLKGAGRAQWDQLVKARHAFGQGRVSEAVGYVGAGLLPLLGPAAAHAGERIAEGDVAGGIGEGVGIAGSIAVPGALARTPAVRIPSPFGRGNARRQAAVEAGQAAGVPIDAATATGNKAIGAVQHMADRSLTGGMVAERALESQARGLATMGEQLAAKGYGSAVTPEQAGAAVRSGIQGTIQKHKGQANAAYDELRQIEARPENTLTVQAEIPSTPGELGTVGRPAHMGFAKPGASTEEIFQGALGDARRQGYAGPAEALRAEFMEKLASGKRWLSEAGTIAAENGPAALLAEIRRLGGIKPWDVDHVPGMPARKLRGEYQGLQQAFEKNWGQRGGGSPFRADGIAPDDLAQQLSADPKWKGLVPDDGEALKTLLEDIAGKGPQARTAPGVADYLEPAGVRPGTRWWSDAAEGAGSAAIAAPVDLRFVRQQLEPILNDLKRQQQNSVFAAGSGEAKALDALDRLLNGREGAARDFVSASDADRVLSSLKSLARTDNPALRTRGQGIASKAVSELEQALGMAVENMGPEAVAALEAGRTATRAKWAAGETLGAVSEEGVRAFRALTARQDSAVGLLRDVAKQAPAELPKIGRAYLDELLTKATSSPESLFEHGAAIANTWRDLGAQTKALLYKDPKYVADLDKFFDLARLMAKNANPSGTAHAVQAVRSGEAVIGALGLSGTVEPMTAASILLGPVAVSKFLHSSAGVRLLTKGFRIPLGSKAARTAYTSELLAFARERGFAPVPAMAEETPGTTEGTTGRR